MVFDKIEPSQSHIRSTARPLGEVAMRSIDREGSNDFSRSGSQ